MKNCEKFKYNKRTNLVDTDKLKLKPACIDKLQVYKP